MNDMDLIEALKKENIDPMTGDCYCVAAALQNTIDPEKKFTKIFCVKNSSYDDTDLAHCMVLDRDMGLLYDATGAYKRSELRGLLLSYYDPDEECIPDEYGDFEDEECIGYNRNYMNRECADKIRLAERIIRQNMPGWLARKIADRLDAKG